MEVCSHIYEWTLEGPLHVGTDHHLTTSRGLLMSKYRSILCGLVALLIVTGSMLSAQTEPAAESKSAAADEQAPERAKPRGRLPNHFGKLGVSEEQRTRIYELQAQYGEQIEALLMQIEELRSQRDAEVEQQLTDSQRSRLQELRTEAAERRKQPGGEK